MHARRGKTKDWTGLLLSAAFVFCVPSAEAQITPNNGAGVDASFNNTPDILNIVAPNSNGLSHNTFTDFNVRPEGLVINNSSIAASSQLAGAVVGNPNLAGGNEARIILNEVISGNMSQLRGFQELVGGQADYILANPNGITCAGCGFISFPRVTLSTGTPDINNGILTGLTVTRGQITITGDGADVTRADMFDLVARNILVDGKINGQDISLITGTNSVDYNTRTASANAPGGGAPALAIDSTALGGIYGGQVKLIATEAGTGVRMRGDMAATAQDITIDARGNIVFSGNQVSASRHVVTSTTGSTTVDNARIHAAGNTEMTAQGTTLSNGGRIGAEGTVTLTGTTLTTTGTNNAVYSGGNATLDMSGNVTLTGTEIESGANLTLNGAAVTTTNSVKIAATGTASLDVASIDNNGTIQGGTSLTLEADTLIRNRNNASLSTQAGTLTLRQAAGENASLDNQSSGLIAGPLLSFDLDALTNNGDITHTGTSAMNVMLAGAWTGSGTTSAQGAINIDAASLTNNGSIMAGQNLTINAASAIANAAGSTLSAGNNLSAIASNAASTFSNAGTVFANGTATLRALGNLSNSGAAATIFARGNVLMGADTAGNIGSQIITNDRGTIESLNGHITLNASTINNQGVSAPAITAGGNAVLNFLTALNNTGGHISADGNITMDGGAGGNLSNTGQITSGNALTLTNGGTFSNSAGGTFSAVNNLSLGFDNGTNNGLIFAGGAMNLAFINQFTNSGANAILFARNAMTLGAANAGSIGAQSIINQTSGRIESLNSGITINAANVTNRSNANILGNSISINFLEDMLNDDARISGVGNVTITAHNTLPDESSLTNQGTGVIEAGGTVSLNGITNVNAVPDNAAGVAGAGNRVDPILGTVANRVDPVNSGTGVPLVAINLPGDSTGFFVPAANPDARYIIETNPAFNINALFGSDYLIRRLGLDPDEIRRMGDNFWEQQYIRDQLIAAFGLRFVVEGAASEDEQYRILMENAGDVAEDLGLTLGVALTKEQVQNLTKDIVWMVEQKVNGETVLVPQVFLTDATRARLEKAPDGMPVLVANNVNINNVHNLRNSGAVLAWNNISMNAGNIQNIRGYIDAGHNVRMEAETDIANRSGAIIAGDNAVLVAHEGSITNETNIKRVGDGNNYRDVAEDTGTIAAGNDVIMVAKQDINNIAADIIAGNNINLLTEEGNVNITDKDMAWKNTWVERKVTTSGWWIFKKTRVTETVHTQTGSDSKKSNLKADNNINIYSQQDINILASELDAGNNIGLYTETGNVDIGGTSHNIIDTFDVTNISRLLGMTISRSTESKTTEDENFVNSSLRAGNNMDIASGGGLALRAGELLAGHNLSIRANDDILNENGSIRAGNDMSLYSIGGDIINSATGLNDRSEIMAGHNMTISAGNDIINRSGVIAAGNDLFLNARDGSITNETNTFRVGDDKNYRDHAGETATLLAGGNLRAEARKDINNIGADIVSGGDTTLIAREGNVNILDKMMEWKNTWVERKVTYSGWWIFKTKRVTNITHTETGTDSKTSTVNAGNNLTIQSGQNINVRASDMAAVNDITLNANSGNVDIGATTNTFNAITNIRKSFSLWGMNMQSESRDITHNDETVTGSSLKAGRNIKINSGGDITLTASDLNAGNDADLNAAGDINLNALTENESIHERFSKQGWTSGGGFAGYGWNSGNSTHTDQTIVGSVVRTGQNLNMNAGQDIDITASTLSAGQDISLRAGRDVSLNALIERETYDAYEKTTRVGFFGGTKGSSAYGSIGGSGSNANLDFVGETAVGSSLSADGRLVINSGNDIQVTASTLSGDQGIVLDADRDINLLALATNNSYTHSQTSHGGGIGISLSPDKSFLGLQYQGSEQRDDMNAKIHSTSTLISEQGTITMRAGQDITEESIRIGAAGDIAAHAGRDFISNAVQDSMSARSSTTNREAGLGIAMNLGLGGLVKTIDDSASGMLRNYYDDRFGGSGDDNWKIDTNRTPSMMERQVMPALHGFYTQKTYTQGWSTDTAMTSAWVSGGNLDIGAGRNITMTGTDILTEGSIALDAGQDVTLLAAQDTHSRELSFNTLGGDLTISPKNKTGSASGGYIDETMRETTTTNSTVSMRAGQDILINAGNDIHSQAADASAGGDMILRAGNDITLDSVSDTYKRTHDQLTAKGVITAGKKEFSASGEFVYEDDTETRSVAQVSNLSAGGNFTLEAGHDATLKGSTIDAGGNAALSAGNDMVFDAVEDTYSRDRTYIDVSASVSSAGKDNKSADAKPGKLDKIKNLGKKLLGNNVNVTVESEDTSMSLARGGAIRASGDLSLSAGNDMTLTGTEGHAGGNLSMTAGNDLNLLAAQSRINSKETSVYVGLDVKNLGFDLGDTNYNATLYMGSSFSAGGDMAVGAGRDMNLSGSTLRSAGDADIFAGRDLNIATLVNHEGFEGFDIGIGYSLTGKNDSMGWAQSDSEIGFNGHRQTLAEAGIQGGTGLNVKSNTTTLNGGYLGVTDGTVNLETGNLTLGDIRAKSEYGSISNWGTETTRIAHGSINGRNVTQSGDGGFIFGKQSDIDNRANSLRKQMQTKFDSVNTEQMQANVMESLRRNYENVANHNADNTGTLASRAVRDDIPDMGQARHDQATMTLIENNASKVPTMETPAQTEAPAADLPDRAQDANPPQAQQPPVPKTLTPALITRLDQAIRAQGGDISRISTDTKRTLIASAGITLPAGTSDAVINAVFDEILILAGKKEKPKN